MQRYGSATTTKVDTWSEYMICVVWHPQSTSSVPLRLTDSVCQILYRGYVRARTQHIEHVVNISPVQAADEMAHIKTPRAMKIRTRGVYNKGQSPSPEEMAPIKETGKWTVPSMLLLQPFLGDGGGINSLNHPESTRAVYTRWRLRFNLRENTSFVSNVSWTYWRLEDLSRRQWGVSKLCRSHVTLKQGVLLSSKKYRLERMLILVGAKMSLVKWAVNVPEKNFSAKNTLVSCRWSAGSWSSWISLNGKFAAGSFNTISQKFSNNWESLKKVGELLKTQRTSLLLTRIAWTAFGEKCWRVPTPIWPVLVWFGSSKFQMGLLNYEPF